MTDAEGQNTNFTMYSEASKQNFNAIPLFNYIEDIIETNTGKHQTDFKSIKTKPSKNNFSAILLEMSTGGGG